MIRTQVALVAAALCLHCGLAMPSSLQAQQETPARSFDFKLKKKGDVLRIRWVSREHNYTEAVAIAFQLANINKSQNEFELNLFLDGAKREKRRFQMGKAIEFKARGLVLPCSVQVTQADKKWIEGQVVWRPSGTSIQVDLYSKGGKLRPPAGGPQKVSSGKKIQKPDDGVKNPVLEHQTLPSYTRAAIEAKIQGKVLLEAVVQKDGSLDNIRVLKSLGYFGLDEAAIEEIANHWKFRPGTLEGKPVDVRATIEVKFVLRR